MNETETKEKIQTALQTVQDLGDPYRAIAFQEVLRSLLAKETPSAKPSEGTKAALAVTRNEFLASKACKTLGDYTMCIFYYAHRKGQTPLTRSEMLTAFAEERHSRPRNVSDVIGDLIRRGYLTDALEKKGGQKAWNITPSGERYVETALQPLENAP